MTSKIHRVSVYIDNSNVFKLIENINKTLPKALKWPKSYDPLFLATILAGPRQLVKTNFYCTPPPEYLKSKLTKDGHKIYWTQISYFEEIKKLKNVELKYGYLTGPPGDQHEKNLDSQIITDMQKHAYADVYDTAVLIAGDGDYLSVVRAVRDSARRVELVYFGGHGSGALMQECDLTRRFRRSFVKSLPFSYNETIP